MNTYPKIRELRKHYDYTQNDLAKALCLQREVYRRYETGQREIPFYIVIRLANFYNVSLDYIAGLTDKTERNL